MTSKDSAEGFALGMLAGAAIGLAVGILYAPHSGTITRGLIDEKVHEATHRAEKIVEEAKDKAENIIKEAKSKVVG
ncbi:MAG: YtxH domain-containing protein [Dehalococcoidales bacterium]|nr:YtxH domain-containing protein [Dehalococcoidales bacterium]